MVDQPDRGAVLPDLLDPPVRVHEHRLQVPGEHELQVDHRLGARLADGHEHGGERGELQRAAGLEHHVVEQLDRPG